MGDLFMNYDDRRRTLADSKRYQFLISGRVRDRFCKGTRKRPCPMYLG